MIISDHKIVYTNILSISSCQKINITLSTTCAYVRVKIRIAKYK